MLIDTEIMQVKIILMSGVKFGAVFLIAKISLIFLKKKKMIFWIFRPKEKLKFLPKKIKTKIIQNKSQKISKYFNSRL